MGIINHAVLTKLRDSVDTSKFPASKNDRALARLKREEKEGRRKGEVEDAEAVYAVEGFRSRMKRHVRDGTWRVRPGSAL